MVAVGKEKEVRGKALSLTSFFGAVNEARTRDPQLGKLMLYQLSYYRSDFYVAKVMKNFQKQNMQHEFLWTLSAKNGGHAVAITGKGNIFHCHGIAYIAAEYLAAVVNVGIVEIY